MSVGGSEAEGAWTNDGVASVSGAGETNVIVQGDTTVTGGAIYSEDNDLTFETSSLTVNDLNDYQYSSSFDFGINLNGGFFNPNNQEAGSGYSSPVIGGLTIGMKGTIKEGITYTVVGEGQILIGDDPDNQILATVKRDADGRQVVTVEDEWGFETITIPLINFNQLAFEAGRIADFISALRVPIPGDVAAMGPNAELLYQSMME